MSILDPETAYFVQAYMSGEGVPSNIDVEDLTFDDVIVLSGATPAEEGLTYEDRGALNSLEG